VFVTFNLAILLHMFPNEGVFCLETILRFKNAIGTTLAAICTNVGINKLATTKKKIAPEMDQYNQMIFKDDQCLILDPLKYHRLVLLVLCSLSILDCLGVVDIILF
jgi:hypothetical protein